MMNHWHTLKVFTHQVVASKGSVQLGKLVKLGLIVLTFTAFLGLIIRAFLRYLT